MRSKTRWPTGDFPTSLQDEEQKVSPGFKSTPEKAYGKEPANLILIVGDDVKESLIGLKSKENETPDRRLLRRFAILPAKVRIAGKERLNPLDFTGNLSA